MKKTFCIIFGIIAGIAILFALYTLYRNSSFVKKLCQYYEYEDCGDYTLGVNDMGRCCFYGCYRYDKSDTSHTITIPDEHNGYKIIALGGYTGRGVPQPFSIDLSVYMNGKEDSDENIIYTGDIQDFDIDKPYTVKKITFTVNLGENFEDVRNISMDNYYPHYNKDGSITFYQPVVFINCSSKNEHFYSKDGVLYEKGSGHAVTDFIYQ